MSRGSRTVAAAFIALAVTACSGGGSPATTPAAFAGQANELCKKQAADDAAGRAALGATPAPQAIIDYTRGGYAPSAITTYQQISNLALPKGQEEAIIALLTDAVAEVKLQQADPLKGGSKALERQIVARMRAAGLTDCGVGFASTLDKTEFAAEAGAVCSRVFADIAAERKKRNIVPTTPPDRVAAFVAETVLPVARAGLEDLRDIGAPAGDEATITQLLTGLQSVIDGLAADPTRLGLVDAGHPAIEATWKAYGVDSCSNFGLAPG